MLYTIYSNSYEVLRACLIESFGTEGQRKPFEPIRIISGSRLINNELMLSIAREKGICSGFEFWTIDNWFFNYVGFGLGVGGHSQEFIWLLWRLLDDEFIGSHPRLCNYFKSHEQHINRDLLRYQLAKELASVFYKYVNYRFDWVIEWMFPNENSRTVEVLNSSFRNQNQLERKVLESNEDYLWQKELWKKLGETQSWIGSHTINMFADWQNLKQKIKAEPSELHFFVPISVSPLMLPIIKLLSEDANHSVFAYILNPCQEYWFGSFEHAETLSSNYLRRNAASTRALINRFNQFAQEDFLSHCSQQTDQIAKDLLRRESLQKIQLFTESQSEWLALKPKKNSLLHQFQRAILWDDPTQLPASANVSDRSIRFIQAPTLTREVDTVINIIHSLYNDKELTGLKAEDILVVTPDIESTAPIIEAALTALPEDKKIAYKIIGRSAIDENKVGRALLELGRLFMSPMDVNQFESWLELPIVTQNLNLSLEDLNIIRDWLVTAGFRQGINADQLQNTKGISLKNQKGLAHEALDGTLDRALERLSWGFVLEDETGKGFDDILPVSYGYTTKFSSVFKENRIFKTLLTLEKKLSDAYEAFLKLGAQASLSQMAQWGNYLIDLFFKGNTSNHDIIALQSALRAIDPRNIIDDCADQRTDDIVIPPSVYWQALEDNLREEPGFQALTGSICFTSMKHFRQLPFKVILVIGLNENSAFPGSQHFEEFDLMGVDQLKRQDDRDSRTDNRNAFLSLILSARERFYCSWSVGTDKKNPLNPSAVVTDFMHFLTSHLPLEKRTEAKKTFLNTLTVSVPLSPASIKNFMSDESQYWKSINTDLMDSLIEAQKEHFQGIEPPIVEGPLSTKAFEDELDIEELIRFYKNPTEWLERRLFIKDYDQTALDAVPLLAPQDPLTMAKLTRQWLEAFDNGLSVDDIINSLDRNPLAGAMNTRTESYREALQVRYEAWLMKKEMLSKALRYDFNTLVKTLDRHGLFRTLVAHNVTLWSFERESTDKSLYLFEICPSLSSESRAKLRALCLSALMERPIGLQYFSINDKSLKVLPPSDKKLAEDVLNYWLTQLQEAVLNITTIDKPSKKSNHSAQESQSIIWRGTDLENVEKRSRQVYDDFEKLLGSWNNESI